MVIKTRFCPSPTGRLHLGNMRTALISWLYARAHNGQYLLRIEDTDIQRSSDEYARFIFADLEELGLQWDEGPVVSAPDEQYYQSNRNHIYTTYFQKLTENRQAYPCFCSPELLARTSKRLLASGQPPRYPGTCRNLSASEVEQKRNNNEPEVLRFAVDNQRIEFADIVKGEQVFRGSDIGDFIIRKNDGSPTFLFCNAVDDALMGVTTVVRGEDHLTNSPRQILVLQALELAIPEYCHLSTVLGKDGAPLSKRNGSSSVTELLHCGYHPLAICNYLARLGHVYEANTLYSLEELATHFQVQKLVSSPCRHDVQQLDFWQKQTVEAMTDEAIGKWLSDILSPHAERYPKEKLVAFVRANIRFPDDAQQWLAMLHDPINYSEQAQQVIRESDDFFAFAADVVDSQEYRNGGWQALTTALQSKGIKGKKLYLPLRAALTATVSGPELPLLAELVGADVIRMRLQAAAKYKEKYGTINSSIK